MALRRIIQTHAAWRVCGEASNGEEGISAAARLRPDVAVLDFSMPVMNGIEAAGYIRQSVPETRLLMFTSYAMPVIEDAARSAGIEDFVDKDNLPMLLRSLQRFEAFRT